MENTHSILRAQTKPSDNGDQLRQKAKIIFQSKKKQSNFRSYFTVPKHFSFSQNQLQFLKVKCAQVLFSILKQLCQKPGEASITSKGRITYIKLPAMCPNDIMKTNVLPLGYQCAVQPDSTKKCDIPGCQITCVLDEDWVLFNGCFHSFHKVCLKESTSCPLCPKFLKKKVWELGNVAKQAISPPASEMQDEVSNISNTSTTTAASTCADEMEIKNLAVRGMGTVEFEHIIEKMNSEISSLEPPPQVLPNVSVSLSEIVGVSSSRAPQHRTKYHYPVKGHK